MRYLRHLLVVLAITMFAANAPAIDLAWDHVDPAAVTGYTIYYAPVDGSLGPFNISVLGGEVMTLTIPDEHFQPNLEYVIHATAYNITGESGPSNTVFHTRHGYSAPPDNTPIVLWFKPGNSDNLHKQ